MTNTETAKATARPWAFLAEGGREIIGTINGVCVRVALVQLTPTFCGGGNDMDEANARLIVKAVNHHDELVEALLYVRDNLVRDPFDNATEPNADVIDRVNAALARVSQ